VTFLLSWPFSFSPQVKSGRPDSRHLASEIFGVAETGLFRGWMLFLTPNQQCQGTKGNHEQHPAMQKFD